MSGNDRRHRQRASRHLAIARSLSDEQDERLLAKFRDRRVLLTGSPGAVCTPRGKLMLRMASNLIARFAGAIDLDLGKGASEVESEIATLVRQIDSQIDLRTGQSHDTACYAAVLSIGDWRLRRENIVRISSEGWLAAVAIMEDLPAWSGREDGVPFGAIAAAALGGAEVFKLLVEPLPFRAARLENTIFSAYSYEVGSIDPGPALPPTIQLPQSLLAGVGAVGNAFLLALSAVPGISGNLAVVDEQCLDDTSNLNRYVLANEGDVRERAPIPKTRLATRVMSGSLVQIHELATSVAAAVTGIEKGVSPRPLVVLSGLDNNEARYELQSLWPDLLLEGATSGTLFQVSRHEYGSGLACLRCIHPRTEATRRYEESLAAASGLTTEWISAAMRNPTEELSASEILTLDPDKQSVLSAHVGKPKCAVLEEIEKLSARAKEDLPIEPAVSFTSMMAGLLMASEFVKFAAGLPTPLRTWYQADPMFTFALAGLQPMRPLPYCYCVERRDVIALYRGRTAGRRHT